MPLMAPHADAPSLAGDDRADRTDWEKATAAVLRKTRRLAEDAPDTDVWDLLTRRTLDDIPVTPLGTPELSVDLPPAGLPGQAPYTRGAQARRDYSTWDIRARFTDPDAKITAEHIMGDLENGVMSLWLTVGEAAIDPADLPTVLKGVLLDLAPVVLEPLDDPLGTARAFLDVMADGTLAPGTNLGADPIGAAVRGHEAASDADAVVPAIAELAQQHGVGGFVVDGTAVHDQGASDVQELAYVLAAGAAYLRRLTALGLDVTQAARLLEFRLAATDEQFPTIAKFRAARLLWNRVTELSGVDEGARAQVQHAVTSRPMFSKYDPYVNMLRSTVAAFAAGVGGATSVTVIPFDDPLGLPEAFSRRIARNTSSLLVSESHVAKVTDPGGGSHLIEKLTGDIARAAWEAFGALESADGIEAVIAEGTLAEQIAGRADERARQIARRKWPVTGLSEFPDLHEILPDRRPHAAGFPQVKRYGEEFEALRDARAQTPVFLATLGPIAKHTARATFAANLFAAGGVDTVTAGPTDTPEAVVAAYREAGTPPVVCLTGHDGDYAEWGAAAVSALREAGATYLIVAGQTDVEVDDVAAVGIDALAFLRRVREQLGADS